MQTPSKVKAAALFWAIAIGAGVAETALVVVEFAANDDLDAAVWVNVGLRSIVYSGAALLVLFFALGRRWARWSLTGLLSVVGLAAMVVPAAMELADGEIFTQAFGTGGDFGSVFMAIRLLHIVAVVAATALMFTRSANRYFAPSD